MIVSEFIEWLKTQDQGATVGVIVTESRHYECSVEKKDFTPELSDYTDLRGNRFVRDDAPYKNKRYLLLGERG